MSRLYEPLPRVVLVGNIMVQTFEEIVFGTNKVKKKAILTRAEERELEKQALARKMTDQQNVLPFVLRYLDLCQISNSARVCSYWRNGCNMYPEYKDVRDCVPWTVINEHDGHSDSG